MDYTMLSKSPLLRLVFKGNIFFENNACLVLFLKQSMCVLIKKFQPTTYPDMASMNSFLCKISEFLY